MDNSKNNYVPVLNILRAVACLGVLAVHLGYATGLAEYRYGRLLVSGQLGVAIFFVISGFVIPYSLWNSDYHIRNFFSFIWKRSVRIDPPYFVVIFLTLCSLNYFSTVNSINIYQLLLHISYLIPFSSYAWYQNIFWTLGIEFQFYLLIGLTFHFIKTSNIKVVWLVLLLTGITGHYLNVMNDSNFIFQYLHYFCMGILITLNKKKRLSLIKAHLSLLVITCFLCFSISISTGLIGYITSLAILHLNYETIVTNFLAKVSYSLYLTHSLIIGIFHQYFKIAEHPEAYFIIISLFCIGLSYLFFLLVEKPALGWSKKISTNTSE